MAYKKIGVILAVIIVIALIWFGISKFYANPDTFLSKQTIKNQIKEYHQMNVKKIQETIYLDDAHVVIPFISETDKYALAFWQWKEAEWQSIGHNAMGAYTIWKVDDQNYLIWNVKPNDSLEYVDLLGQREREYGITNGNDFYHPEIDMTEKLNVSKEVYGMKPLPSVWDKVIFEFQPHEPTSTNEMFHFQSQPPEINVGWVPYDSQDQILSVDNYFSGNSGGSGGGKIVHIFRLTEDEIK
ncbi:hypothetical protein [Gracilibacillus massiliensis]|uniref:hypothetical protein n=1 Tax=Gracilibacillus massiliensis TaxID=1564956 RepID=UPI00071CE492|nr:hypothetical protein [Gracilibacillus massiliensis]